MDRFCKTAHIPYEQTNNNSAFFNSHSRIGSSDMETERNNKEQR